MSTPVFTVGQTVATFDKHFEPELTFGSEGTITEVVMNVKEGKIKGYDVDVTLADGTPDNFFFFTDELKPVE